VLFTEVETERSLPNMSEQWLFNLEETSRVGLCGSGTNVEVSK